VSVLLDVLCRYVHSECDEGVEQNKLKPDDYVCLACKNRDTLPVCQFCSCVICCFVSRLHLPLLKTFMHLIALTYQYGFDVNLPVICVRLRFHAVTNVDIMFAGRL